MQMTGSYLLAASSFLRSSSSSMETSLGRELLLVRPVVEAVLEEGEAGGTAAVSTASPVTQLSAAVTDDVTSVMMTSLSPLKHDSDDNLRLTQSLSVAEEVVLKKHRKCMGVTHLSD